MADLAVAEMGRTIATATWITLLHVMRLALPRRNLSLALDRIRTKTTQTEEPKLSATTNWRADLSIAS